MPTNNCKTCDTIFDKKHYQQRYCSVSCRELFHQLDQKTRVAKNGPLSKQINCIICKSKFIRHHSAVNYCSIKCKDIRITELRKKSNSRQKKSLTYISARQHNICICKVCSSSFKSSNKKQKCCSNSCRGLYQKKSFLNWSKNKRTIDVNYKIAANLRSRLSRAVKNNYKCLSAIDDLGCSIEELKCHLESRFQPEMTWENYGKTGWHIDHIKPLSSFDLTDREQAKYACHYTNLQPLWAKDNLSKGSKYETR